MKGKPIAPGVYISISPGLSRTAAILLLKQRINQLGLLIICEDTQPDGSIHIKVKV